MGARMRSLRREAYDILMPLVPSEGHHGSDFHREFGTGLHRDVPRDVSLVTTATPLVWRRGVWRIAQYFQREFEYDFVQYGHGGREDDKDAIAYLWHHGEMYGPQWSDTCYGACCFRWRDWKDMPAGWALQWIWFHPFERRKGHLKAVWPFFRRTFGDFVVERPISAPMMGFLRKEWPDYRFLPKCN